MTELIVALDAWNNEEVYNQVKSRVTWFKIGLHSFLLEENLWQKILDDDRRLFFDFKLFDTADTIDRLLSLIKAEMVTIHIQSLHKIKNATPKLIQVHSLTDEKHFSNTPIAANADGVVCNVEIGKTLSDIITICPGIRLEGMQKNNHIKTFTPKEANHPNIDYIVVGRPIYNAVSPLQVVDSILNDLT